MKISLKLMIFMAAVIYFACLFIPEAITLSGKNTDEKETEADLFVPGYTQKTDTPANAPFDKDLTYSILDEKSGEIFKISERDFLISTVSLELSPLTDIEALKAQAVAARSFYRYKKEENKNVEYDFVCNSEEPYIYAEKSYFENKWGESYGEYYEKIANAVDSTENEILTFEGEIACCSFFAMSGGVTLSAEEVWDTSFPYLVSVASPYDSLSPYFEAEVSFTPEEVKNAVTIYWKEAKFDFSLPYEEWFKDIRYNVSCNVKSVNICSFSVTGNEVRKAFNLRSSTFNIVYEKGVFIFKTKGYGHGVGMSQTGASYMAESGCDYREILSLYYKGTTLIKL
ncbi:MAG: SpoIID/LytB domain-containing protein [Ruminococcaceae bacterium]|nr:SpoIID/LytB domain-containing protein [Oscillospiraceae bacterium]